MRSRDETLKAKDDERHAYHHGDLRAALLVAAEAELAEKGVEGFTLRGAAAIGGDLLLRAPRRAWLSW